MDLILKLNESNVCWGIGTHNHQSLLVVFAMFQCCGVDAQFIALQVLQLFSSRYVLFHFDCDHLQLSKKQ